MPFALTLASLLLAQAAPATTPSPAPAASVQAGNEATDTRCLVAFAAIGSQQLTPAQAEAAKLGALYFYGRLVGRNPRIDLAAAMRGAAKPVETQLRPELTRCGGELGAAGGAMQAASRSLATPAAETPPPTPAKPR